MNNIKIRYTFRHKGNGNIEMKWYSIGQLEERAAAKLSPVFSDEYELISRDLYTGFKDKNGREIYEGDCYTAKHKSGKVYTGQVKYELSFVFDIKGFEELFINGVGAVKTNRTFDIHSFIKWFDEVEVICNIYEEPELLEASHASK
ncbi:YopX family protein [Bacillus inaquosorum]|uniref:YopX family protein n=1 Tax=Bacillus inaquosorum TaxID=483913 RepID=UPI00227F9394|nr:YopX family protein [Bacillus inaquosorum]MCY9296165.1 YopX family protein [Bacillus inaquosorum]